MSLNLLLFESTEEVLHEPVEVHSIAGQPVRDSVCKLLLCLPAERHESVRADVPSRYVHLPGAVRELLPRFIRIELGRLRAADGEEQHVDLRLCWGDWRWHTCYWDSNGYFVREEPVEEEATQVGT